MVEDNGLELLVNEDESLVLEAMAQSDAPFSQRAQAILAVDAGSTIAQAARVANLKDTQVRYWIGRFRNGRLSVFPEALLEELRASLRVKAEKSAPKAKKAKTKKTKKAKVKKSAKKAKMEKSAKMKKRDKKKKEKKADKKKKESITKAKKKKKAAKKSAKKKKN